MKKIMDMSPWSYEKQLILLEEFEGEQVPKDISIRQSPFWVQIYNLPLMRRTCETGRVIGSTLGEVMPVDAADSGVQWGKYLRVRVKIDVTKKLVRGKKVMIEGGEQRWINFRYERLPNFCYRCGLLNHDLRDYAEASDKENKSEKFFFQYRPWLRGEVLQRSGSEAPKGGQSFGPSMGDKQCGNEGKLMEKIPHSPLATVGMGGDVGSMINSLESRHIEDETSESDSVNQTPGNIHEKGMDSGIGVNTGSISPF